MSSDVNAVLTQPTKKIDHWYKEPWNLLVIGGPLVVVFASILTGYIAFNGADNVIAEDYYKQGLRVNLNIQRDAKARELGMSATISVNPATNAVSMDLTSTVADGTALPESVQISFANANEDKTSVNEIVKRLRLVQTRAGHYEAETPKPIASGTTKLIHVKVETNDWRLTGDWFEPGQGALQLKAS
jgi:uncharacterized protein